MKPCFYISRVALYTLFFLGIFNLSYSKTNEFNYDAKSISNYFSGLVSFDDFDYQTSQIFFKKLDNLENENKAYSSKFIQSLINLQKYKEAHRYSKKIEKKNLSNFESNLYLGLHAFKQGNYTNAQFYFDKLKPNFENKLVFDILYTSINIWTNLGQSKNKEGIKLIELLKSRSNNIAMVQKMFANCYLGKSDTEKEFQNIITDKKSNFSRYNFFFANYLVNNKKKNEATQFINLASKKYPRILLINQFKNVLNKGEDNKNQFNCKNTAHIMGEVFYVLANAFSSQGDYRLSNFYINLSKFLNPSFLSYDTLLAENFYALKINDDAKKIYRKISRIGSVYNWYASKQITVIMEEEDAKNSLNFLSNVYRNINPNIYQTYDFANLLRTKEKYKKSIELYSQILLELDEEHELYSKVLERRGTAYERSDNWEFAEKDLIRSLEIVPDEPYVMNYLAYSWVEQNKNIDEALTMLRKANNLKKHDGYITDSLGWALYKLKNFSEAKKYLEMAIILMPTDPIVNDHFADCLWMNKQEIEARYYWNNVLKSDAAEEELKKKVEKKLLFGLEDT